MDTEELEGGDILYFSPTDVDGRVSSAFRFTEVDNELFDLFSIEGEVEVSGTPCC